MVLGLDDLDAEALAQPLAHSRGEVWVGVDAGTDGRSAQGYLDKIFLGFPYALYTAPYLPGVALEFLAEADGGRILQVRPTDLDDVVELAGLLFERAAELFDGGH